MLLTGQKQPTRQLRKEWWFGKILLGFAGRRGELWVQWGVAGYGANRSHVPASDISFLEGGDKAMQDCLFYSMGDVYHSHRSRFPPN